MPESLENQFISDLYTSLLHLSGGSLGEYGPLNQVFDGSGNATGMALSGDRVIINNYIYPRGFSTRTPLEWLDSFFPIGCLQLTFGEDDPTDRIAGTTWSQVAHGRFLVGTGLAVDKHGIEREFCPGGLEEEQDGLRGGSGDIAGEYRTALTELNLPAHSHEVNTGARSVQVSNPAGTDINFEAPTVGLEDATEDFAEQVRARYALGQAFRLYPSALFENINFQPPGLIDRRTATEQGPLAWVYSLDLGFQRGSAASKYSAALRSLYTEGDLANEYNFKEVIGLWDGESRFVADKRVEVGTTTSSGSTNSVRVDKTPYQVARELGAVDIGSAEGAALVAQGTPMQITSGPVDAVETDQSANNTRTTDSVGENIAHNNIPPSYGIYVWKRIA